MSSVVGAFEIEHTASAEGDGSFDLLFGSTVILLIALGYALSALWSSLVPKQKALLRSLSCRSLFEMPWSARSACITMLADFDARSDPIAAAAKEAKSLREEAKKSPMSRNPSLPTLQELDEPAWAKTQDDFGAYPPRARDPATKMRRIASTGSCESFGAASGCGGRGGAARALPGSRLRPLQQIEEFGAGTSKRNVLAGGYTTRSASPIPVVGTTPRGVLLITDSTEGGESKPGDVPCLSRDDGDASPTDIEWEPPLEGEAMRRRKSSTGQSGGSPITERTGPFGGRRRASS